MSRIKKYKTMIVRSKTGKELLNIQENDKKQSELEYTKQNKKYPETIGNIDENGYITKDYDGQGFIYKNYKAFFEKSNDICYIPELCESININNETQSYTYQDFLDIAKGTFENNNLKGNPEKLAELLFEFVDWQSPETMIDEWETMGEFEDYPEQYTDCNHSFIDEDNNGIYGKEKCRFCGEKEN